MQDAGITCVAVGPGAAASAGLAAACEPFVTSVILGADVVPRLSYRTVDAFLDELAKKSPALNLAATLRKGVADTFAPLAAARGGGGRRQGGPGGGVELAEVAAGGFEEGVLGGERGAEAAALARDAVARDGAAGGSSASAGDMRAGGGGGGGGGAAARAAVEDEGYVALHPQDSDNDANEVRALDDALVSLIC